jgi:hypothetical protein
MPAPSKVKHFIFPVVKGPNDLVMFEDDPLGQKRNVLINSPSKVAGISVLAKRSKGTGEDDEQASDVDKLAAAEVQPRLDH